MKKTIQKIVAVLCLAVMAVANVSLFASAASISSNKRTASGVNASQTVYIKTNTNWNTEYFGDKYRTKIQIRLGNGWYEYFQPGLTTSVAAKMKVTIYKKSGSSWSKYSQGTYCCNNTRYLVSGAITKTFVLPGKGVNYKIVFTPLFSDPDSGLENYSKPANLKNMTVSITSYGTITSVK